MENILENYLDSINKSNDIYLTESKLLDFVSNVSLSKLKSLIPDFKSASNVEDLKKIKTKLNFLPNISMDMVESIASKQIVGFKENKKYALSKINKIKKIPDSLKSSVSSFLAITSSFSSNPKAKIDEEIEGLEIKGGLITLVFILLGIAAIVLKIVIVSNGGFFLVFPIIFLLIIINSIIQNSIDIELEELKKQKKKK